ncbi:hypothetical protein MPTK1_4g03650 [Marchantia polymorpha subsp. ruderalis]
MLKELGKMTP